MKSRTGAILIAGFIAGTMGILAAIYLLAHGNALGTLRFIASGVFGKQALQGGPEMAVYGLMFHYIIATSFTVVYFFLFPRVPVMKKNKWISAIAFGIAVWSVMNLLILPMTSVTQHPLNLIPALKNIFILVVCIGIPVSFFADRFYGPNK